MKNATWVIYHDVKLSFTILNLSTFTIYHTKIELSCLLPLKIIHNLRFSKHEKGTIKEQTLDKQTLDTTNPWHN